MQKIERIVISPQLISYLETRGLEKQFQKTKQYILSGNSKIVNLKLREPKSERVWYFRINKQYRAVGKIDGTLLYVYAIDNHQN